MEEKKTKTFDRFFYISLIIFLAFVVIVCFFPIWFTHNSSSYDFSDKGQIGDTIGGIMGPFIAIAASILTFLAFWVQYKANEQQKVDISNQKRNIEKDKLENHFFEMIKFHRDNVNELNYTFYQKNIASTEVVEEDSRRTAIGRKVFKIIYDDFKNLYIEVTPYFKDYHETEIYLPEVLQALKKNPLFTNRQIDLAVYAKIDIVFSMLYFGLSSDGKKILTTLFSKSYTEVFYNRLIFFVSLKPKREDPIWSNWYSFYKNYTPWGKEYFNRYFNEIESYSHEKETTFLSEEKDLHYSNWRHTFKRKYEKFYGGHQFRLGHYFRNLYQTVKFINENKLLTYQEKYDKIKMLRSQLSTYEQIILFLNSISFLGRAWELEFKKTPEVVQPINQQLITKYNLIKNIPDNELLENIYLSQFYPLVEYEIFQNLEKIVEKEKLKKFYN